MTTSSPKSRQIQSQLANIKKYRPNDAGALEAAQREFSAARIEDYITRTLEKFPPLTPSQADRLAALLRGGRDKASERSAVA